MSDRSIPTHFLLPSQKALLICLGGALLFLNPVRAQAEAPSAPPARLSFLDGSNLSGQLLELNANGHLSWKHPESLAPFQFESSNLSSIDFNHQGAVLRPSLAKCLFNFVNGDEIFGDLVSLDEQRVIFNASVGGRISAARTSLESITVFSKAYRVVYEGPSSLDDWDPGRRKETWDFRNHSIIGTGTGTLGRNFPLEESCQMEFDLEWDGNLYLTFAAFVQSVDRLDYSGDFYKAIIRTGVVYLQKYRQGGQPIVYDQVLVNELTRATKVRLGFVFDRSQGKVDFFVNSRHRHSWNDPQGIESGGNGILFSTYSPNAELRISRMNVATWQGEYVQRESIDGDEDSDRIFLINGDTAQGQLGAIRENMMTFETPIAPFQIPLDRVTQILLAGNEPPPGTDHVNSLIRTRFHGGGALSFQLVKWDSKDVIGIHPFTGDVRFDPASIQEIEFNLDRKNNDLKNEPDLW